MKDFFELWMLVPLAICTGCLAGIAYLLGISYFASKKEIDYKQFRKEGEE